MARKLRIAVSVFFGLLTVALCVLWVRSHRLKDMAIRPATVTTILGSDCGYIYFVRADGQLPPVGPNIFWGWQYFNSDQLNKGPVRFEWSNTPWRFKVKVPYRYMVAFFGCVTALLLIPQSKRFSLRTLLLATTLLALVLGLGVWLAR